MTKKEALQILIKSGSNDCRGSGLGYRKTSDEWREKVLAAAKKIWKEAFGREFDDSDKHNYF